MLELNKIYNMDCIVGMQQIPDKSIDMILCDLPYGTTQCKWDIVIPFDQLWTQYNRIIKDNGAILLFGTEPFSSHLRLSNIKIYKYDWVWDKVKGTGFLNANRQPMRNHEFVHVFYKKQPTYNPQKTSGHKLKQTFRKNDQQTDVYGLMGGNSYSSTERYPRSIQAFSTDTQKSNIHPTQKPVALIEYLIKTYTNEGDLVFDGCSGSGTTAVAAINTNRKFLCMEKEKEYFDKSVERVTKAGDS
ncbi:site-specific DNA-methyltransferase [Enterococcus ureilyticus]|uniref:DNA-methyltransferase n=1 Tax=Enterococcus ureilyticus TaxID=1131292 RepID=UPI001A916E51|nr:site-specific DNA-methyltransferase [Enterococcus ureilyticus]MBO0445573.1 site-specific DNA-methyltransferase [Enterococcus ureilyticus]